MCSPRLPVAEKLPSSASREIRGIPIWLLREYLESAGGTSDGHSVRGAGWQATLERIEDFRLGSLVVGQVRLDLVGEAEALATLLEVLEPRLVRAGG